MRTKKMYLVPLNILIVLTFLIVPLNASASSISARNAILIEQDSGRVLYEKNAHDVQRIASITKIMTAIIAIEANMMDETVKMSEKAVLTEGSSLYLQKGEKIKLDSLVYGLMLRSGNDAAVAIAEQVGGSLEGFVYLMNQKAEMLGMENTHFANPHGLDDHEDHYSTAYDMAILTRYAMNNETFKKVSGTKSYEAPNPESKWNRKWKNKNRLLTEKYRYTTGGKTGFTKRANRTLVTTATKGKLDLIVVTLDAPDDWNDHIQLFEHGFSTYKQVTVLEKGNVNSIKNDAYRKQLYIKKDVELPLQKDEYDDVRVKYELNAPSTEDLENSDKETVVGRAIIYFKEVPMRKVPIYFVPKEAKEKEKTSFLSSLLNRLVGVKQDG